MMGGMKQHTKPWIGPWLNSVRLAAGIDAATIASKLGVHPSSVARRECADQRIVADDLPSILEAYGVSPAAFVAKLKEQMAS